VSFLRTVVILVLVVTTFPAMARADDEARARELFTAGREAMNRGDYQAACNKFEASLALFRRASMLLNLGACHEKLGELATALRYWRDGLSALEIDDPRVSTAKDAIAGLETRTPRIAVRLPPDLPSEALVAIDGEAIALSELSEPVCVDPGTHALTVDAPGREQWRVSVEAGEGRLLDVELELGPEVAPDVVTVTEPNTAQLVMGWVIGGVGVAGIAMGAVTGGLVLDRKATVEEHCQGDVCTDPAGVEAADEGRTLSILSTAGFIGGAALVGVGIALVLTAELGDDDEERTAMSLTFSPRGVAVAGTF
jgi:hypothetical protein